MYFKKEEKMGKVGGPSFEPEVILLYLLSYQWGGKGKKENSSQLREFI